MTQSGAPEGDKAALEQEGMWDDAQGARASSDPDAPGAGRAGDGRTQGLTETIRSTEHVAGPAGLYYADVPNRIMALIIDIIVLSVIGFALAWLFGGLVDEPGALDSAGGSLDVVAFSVVLVLQLAISFGYFGSLWVLAGTTVGMQLLGLRIRDETGDGPITWRQAIVRWLFVGIPSLMASLAVYVPSTIAVVLSVIGVAWLLLLLYSVAQSETKQGLHDRYAHSIVVKTRRRTA